MAKIGHVLFEQIGLEGLVQTGSSFGSRGHYGWCHSTRQNFLYFLYLEPYAYLASFWSYGVETKLQKIKIGCYGNVPRWIENRGSGHYLQPWWNRMVKTTWKSVQWKSRLSGWQKSFKKERNYNNIHKQNIWLPGSLLCQINVSCMFLQALIFSYQPTGWGQAAGYQPRPQVGG